MCPSAVAGCTPWRIWRRRGRRVGRGGTGIGVGKSDGEFDLFASEIARLAASNHNFNHCWRVGGWLKLAAAAEAEKKQVVRCEGWDAPPIIILIHVVLLWPSTSPTSSKSQRS